MDAIKRKLSQFKAVDEKAECEYDEHDQAVMNMEYSIAIEYLGPPVNYDVPHAVPIEFDQITTATSLINPHTLSLFVPVIQPLLYSKKPVPVASPEIVELPADDNYMNPRSWSEDDEGDEYYDGDESPIFAEAEETPPPDHGRKPSVSVTFREPEKEEEYWSESSSAEVELESPETPRRAVRAGPKGACYRCNRGSRLTAKEKCIVCGAKYCWKCVVRAMGSMPEGRKCVGCIGRRIDEAGRGGLGRRPVVLFSALSKAEVALIMKAELVCVANQMPANLVFVNGEPLTPPQLLLLQTCSAPPSRLKPGPYWYDNVCGFWGKEGNAYSEIISPQLKVGGHIERNCSNGDTNICINGREITKIERMILQLAGVPCEGSIHYWVDPDGSYQLEGMNNVVKGKIWDKAIVKLACTLLSLPILSESPKPSTEKLERAVPVQLDGKMLHKFLLVGSDQSGTSTIFKQAKRLYNVPFSEEERENIKSMIQCKLYGYLGLLLQGREKFEEECLVLKRRSQSSGQPSSSGNIDKESTMYSLGPRLKPFEDWLIMVMESGNLEVMFPAATREYAKYVEDLWNNPAIQATYSRRNELETLPRAATYFLNRAIEISRTDYEPTDTDILFAEGINSSNSIASLEFSCPRFEQDSLAEAPLLRSQLIRVHPSNLGENCRWLQMFEDVDMVLFCISLSDYDEFTPNGINKMMATKHLFESIVTHPSFEKKHFLLLLNKYDLLEEKVERVPLTCCEWFSDFLPVINTNPNPNANNNNRNRNLSSITRTRNNNDNNNNRRNNQHSTNSPTLAHRAFQYIAMKYKRLFHSLTDRKLYISLINGLESDTIDDCLCYAAEIMKWEEERPKFIAEQISSTSIEASTSS